MIEWECSEKELRVMVGCVADLVTAGSVPSTPIRRAPSGLFANAQMPSPKHAPSPGLPPLLARSQSVLEPEVNDCPRLSTQTATSS